MLRIQTIYITEVQWNGRLGSLKHSEGKRSIHMTCTSVISMNGLASFDFIPVVHIFFWEVCKAVFPPSLLIYPEMWFKPWVSPTSLAAAVPGTKTCTSKICSFTVPWHCLAAETLVFRADTPDIVQLTVIPCPTLLTLHHNIFPIAWFPALQSGTLIVQ